MPREEARARVIEDSTSGVNLTVNADGSLNNFSLSKVSTNNSSATPLGSSGVFMGTGEEVTKVTHVTVSVYSDVASAINGLSIQFSTDNVSWDHKDTFSIPAATGKTFTIQRIAKYFRVVYTNGTTAQSSFRLQVILNATHTKSSTHRIQDSIISDDDAELVKAVLTGQDSVTGNFTDLQSRNNRLLVSQDVEAPAGTTPVTVQAFGDVASTAGVDTYYTITNGYNLTIQQLSAGAEGETGGSIVELFWDPDGDLGVNLERIDTIFIDSATNQIEINTTFTGDGTARIVLRRRGYTSSAREMSARWIGFEEEV